MICFHCLDIIIIIIINIIIIFTGETSFFQVANLLRLFKIPQVNKFFGLVQIQNHQCPLQKDAKMQEECFYLQYKLGEGIIVDLPCNRIILLLLKFTETQISPLSLFISVTAHFF